MACGIYKITENETGRCYIGQSKNIEARWRDHRKRFPTDLFSYEILMSCDPDCLNFFEKAFIDGYDSHRCGFNKTIGGTAIKARYPHADSLAKRSESMKGKNRGPRSEETKRKISEAKKGKKFSEEHKKALSESHKGLVPWNKKEK